MFGDVLKQKAYLLKDSSLNKMANNAFWKVLRDIATEDIINYYPEKVDSINAIQIYYSILKENEQFIPNYLCEEVPSNGQERYRIINRNLWSSNAFHTDGLANQKGIIAEKKLNTNRSGYRILYGGINNDNKE